MERTPQDELFDQTLQAEQATRLRRDGGDGDEPPASQPAKSPDDLARVEATLEAIREQLEFLTRERRYHEFSLVRALGVAAQIVVLGFAIFALSEFVYGQSATGVIVKLMFAGVFQLAALTAFVVSRGR
jgi:hypothetical protein